MVVVRFVKGWVCRHKQQLLCRYGRVGWSEKPQVDEIELFADIKYPQKYPQDQSG